MISFNSFLGQNWAVPSGLGLSQLSHWTCQSYLHQHQPAAPTISPSLRQRQFWENTEILYALLAGENWRATSQLNSAPPWREDREESDSAIEISDLLIRDFKSGCLLAWFDVSLFASSACWVNWTLKNFLFMLLHWKCSRGNSLRWECEVSMLDVVINKIIPRLNIAFRQARITQSSNQQSLNYNKTSPDCHQPRSVSPNGGNMYIMNILSIWLGGGPSGPS